MDVCGCQNYQDDSSINQELHELHVCVAVRRMVPVLVTDLPGCQVFILRPIDTNYLFGRLTLLYWYSFFEIYNKIKKEDRV